MAHIIVVFYDQGQYKEVHNYYQVAPLYQRFGDEIDKIDIRYNLATLYISLRRFDIAITC